MKRFGAVVLASLASAALPGLARAADVTRVASSFEDQTPFGMYIDLGYERTQELAKISREWHQNGDLQDLNELRYTGVDSRLNADAHIGIYKDLELHYGLPIILARTESWRYAGGTTAANSTIANNCLNPDGTLINPLCPVNNTGAQPMFPVPSNSYRGGLGNMTFGIAYAFFNQAKDDTKPTWVMGVDYEAPTADLLDPTVRTSSSNRGSVGDKQHRYTFWTGLSRKYTGVEPYFKGSYTVPFNAHGFYSNCDHPAAGSMGRPENCGVGPWSRVETGTRAAQTASVEFGSEFNLLDDTKSHQKVAFDLRGIANYVGPSRSYNEMSYLFGKLLKTEDHLQVGGRLAFTAQAADWVAFKAAGSLLYTTEHGLTDETPGQDLNGDGKVDLAAGSKEANPNYDFRSDVTGRRFRISEIATFRLEASINFYF